MKFIDEINIQVVGGDGGRGLVSFERERFRPWGGPDGGNGGNGGNVYIEGHPSLLTLGKLMRQKVYKAKNGQDGKIKKQSGRKADSLTLYVPLGTEVRNENQEILGDLNKVGFRCMVAKGGRGGLGNYNFVSATRQTPRYAQPGEIGERLNIHLELKLLADVGLVGLPNVGKSTILSKLSRKDAEIGDYPFTTLIPNIGVVEEKRENSWRRLYLADIPGIIEGAHQGAGLGLSFLKHIERVSAIIYLLDLNHIDFEKIELQYDLLHKEIESYEKKLLERPTLIAINKCDLISYDKEIFQSLKERLARTPLWKKIKGPKPKILFISAQEGRGMEDFRTALFSLVPQASLAEKVRP